MNKFLLSLLLAAGSLQLWAQDTTRTTRRGDRNTEITTSSRSNVPKSQRDTGKRSIYAPKDPIGGDQPDVLLDVPNLSLDSLSIRVDNLNAKLSLDARVANLVSLKAGVEVNVDKVDIKLAGVQATALLIVRLDNVRAIIDKTLTTLENNPELLDRLLTTVDSAVSTVGNVANTALQPGGVISQTVNTLGQTVQRTLDAMGNIVEKTLDSTGKVLSTRTVGKLLDLPVVSETVNAAGQTVKRLRDTSGQIIEVVLDKAGKIVGTSLTGGGNDSGTQR